MTQADDRIVKAISVPAWMVYGAVTLIAVLSGGPIGQVVMLSHHVYENQRVIAEVKVDTEREISAIKVKQDDFVAAFKSISNDIQQINQSLAVLNSKMP